MSKGPSIEKLTQFVGDPARVSMLAELISGRALTATELANVSGITRQTARSYLQELQKAELLVVHSQGRHQYFRLANEEVAAVFARLDGLAERSTHVPLITGPKDSAMRKARSCYDHLAGPLAVAFYAQGVEQRWFSQPNTSGCLSRTVELTRKGADMFGSLGIPVDEFKKGNRAVCKACLDWSERKDHLAGAMGAELLRFCVVSGWAKQEPDSRVVVFTKKGEEQFRKVFGIH